VKPKGQKKSEDSEPPVKKEAATSAVAPVVPAAPAAGSSRGFSGFVEEKEVEDLNFSGSEC
jgi:hypothetical protein